MSAANVPTAITITGSNIGLGDRTDIQAVTITGAHASINNVSTLGVGAITNSPIMSQAQGQPAICTLSCNIYVAAAEYIHEAMGQVLIALIRSNGTVQASFLVNSSSTNQTQPVVAALHNGG